MPGRVISAFDKGRIIALHDAGHSNHQISETLRIPRASVVRIVHRYEEFGTVETRPRSGRPRASNEREDRYLVQFARRHRTASAPALRVHFQGTFRRVISTSTIQRRLHSANLRARRPLRVPTLLPRHRAARLQWAQERRGWFLGRWRWVIFTDETRFGLVSDDRRQRVWREPGRQQRLNFPREVVPYEGGTVMFWGGIMFNRRTPLIRVPQTMTSQIYMENIITPIIYPLRNELGANFVFMDDNARPHRAVRVQEALEAGQITRLNWPANSPDMNPIEHMWDFVARAIRNRINPPRTLEELAAAAVEEWNNIPQDIINRLIISMPRRVNALLISRGGYTDY